MRTLVWSTLIPRPAYGSIMSLHAFSPICQCTKLGIRSGELRCTYLEQLAQGFHTRQVSASCVRRHALAEVPSNGALVRRVEHEARRLCKDARRRSL